MVNLLYLKCTFITDVEMGENWTEEPQFGRQCSGSASLESMGPGMLLTHSLWSPRREAES